MEYKHRFFCDYGYNVICGDHVFFNFNCIIPGCDLCKNRSHYYVCGPNVQIYTATHPVSTKKDLQAREFLKPLRSVKMYGGVAGVVICPGVTIGDQAVIGAEAS